jgi:hypothetical protein
MGEYITFLLSHIVRALNQLTMQFPIATGMAKIGQNALSGQAEYKFAYYTNGK